MSSNEHVFYGLTKCFQKNLLPSYVSLRLLDILYSNNLVSQIKKKPIDF